MNCNGFECIFWCLIVLTILLFLLGLYFYIKKVLEYRKIVGKRKKYIEAMNLGIEEKGLLNELADRTFVIYYSYVIHTTMFMLCNIYGIMFTIASFVFSFSETSDFYSYIVSFLAIFFVVIIIYITPQRRATQFLKAWRRLNNELLNALYGGINMQDRTNKNHIINIMKKMENSFAADEDNL